MPDKSEVNRKGWVVRVIALCTVQICSFLRRCERYRPRFFPLAAVQIYVEHAAIVAQIDLKVALQAGVSLNHGYHRREVLLYPQSHSRLVTRRACTTELEFT